MDTNKFCPICFPGRKRRSSSSESDELHLMSTTNEWKYKCPVCRRRFNEQLEEMWRE